LIGRRNQLNYREALANDLPIGSGEIESAHRYIAQLRLKRPGAWWRVGHVDGRNPPYLLNTPQHKDVRFREAPHWPKPTGFEKAQVRAGPARGVQERRTD